MSHARLSGEDSPMLRRAACARRPALQSKRRQAGWDLQRCGSRNCAGFIQPPLSRREIFDKLAYVLGAPIDPMRCAAASACCRSRRGVRRRSPRASRRLRDLGQNTSRAEPADQLPARSEQSRRALIDQDGAAHRKTPSDAKRPSVSGKVSSRSSACRGHSPSVRDPTANRPFLSAAVSPFFH